MKSRITGILLVIVLSGISIQRAEAQLGDNDSTVDFLAMQVGASAGISADNYRSYAEKLAKTIANLDSGQQATVFGFVPFPTVSTQSASSSSIVDPTSTETAGSGTDSSGSNWWEGLMEAVKDYFESRG